MADVHNKSTRSYNMSMIKGKDTVPEIIVRKFLHKHGYRFRLHKKGLPGKPDVVLPMLRVVIFVNGCYWHGHEGCKYFVLPKTRKDWWKDKIEKNRANDRNNEKALLELDWKVITIWECSLRPNTREKTLELLLLTLNRGQNNFITGKTIL